LERILKEMQKEKLRKKYKIKHHLKMGRDKTLYPKNDLKMISNMMKNL
jgi:hypothetical protein